MPHTPYFQNFENFRAQGDHAECARYEFNQRNLKYRHTMCTSMT